MIQEMSIELLSEKMKELENALFVTESNTLLKLPTHIVQIAEVDEEGNAWFIIPKPTQVIDSFEPAMPAKLDFFKKGKGFYLKLRGLASIVQSVDLMPATRVFRELSGSFKNGELVAVKLKMQAAEYAENARKTNINPVRNIGTAVYNWLLEPLLNVKKRDWVMIPVYAENS